MVALTRASFRTKWGKPRETTVSRFVHEMFEEMPEMNDEIPVFNDD